MVQGRLYNVDNNVKIPKIPKIPNESNETNNSENGINAVPTEINDMIYLQCTNGWIAGYINKNTVIQSLYSKKVIGELDNDLVYYFDEEKNRHQVGYVQSNKFFMGEKNEGILLGQIEGNQVVDNQDKFCGLLSKSENISVCAAASMLLLFQNEIQEYIFGKDPLLTPIEYDNYLPKQEEINQSRKKTYKTERLVDPKKTGIIGSFIGVYLANGFTGLAKYILALVLLGALAIIAIPAFVTTGWIQIFNSDNNDGGGSVIKIVLLISCAVGSYIYYKKSFGAGFMTTVGIMGAFSLFYDLIYLETPLSSWIISLLLIYPIAALMLCAIPFLIIYFIKKFREKNRL
ncbi:Uncharacterised protein [Faecalicoccus pleomorphus]|uniref:Uncharacterized protein n=1 Tax=Faecalicoccus pleomorphus TaxID=1323 RepID=A0A380LIS7_9FIRM|nr:hypothetical protein [Faecalicoccus pleomorphus]SUO03211.1 Uncharacterised protein [Faecalicoccus pleomorphus]